jgi:diguanylate cyclase (GGDEF)-like protein
MELDKHLLHMTVSIGLSGIDARQETDIEPWLERADQAMYRAKEQGRNRVVCFED